MRRHFYLSDNLEALTQLARKLRDSGIEQPKIHTLSRDDAGLERRDLPQVQSLLRKDLVHSTLVGALVGVFVGAVPLLVAYLVGLNEGYLWIPVVFLSIILLGFCTWEGGLIGIHRPNRHFRKFQQALNEGKHLLIADVEPADEATINELVYADPKTKDAGVGSPIPDWVVRAQLGWRRLTQG